MSDDEMGMESQEMRVHISETDVQKELIQWTSYVIYSICSGQYCVTAHIIYIYYAYTHEYDAHIHVHVHNCFIRMHSVGYSASGIFIYILEMSLLQHLYIYNIIIIIMSISSLYSTYMVRQECGCIFHKINFLHTSLYLFVQADKLQ